MIAAVGPRGVDALAHYLSRYAMGRVADLDTGRYDITQLSPVSIISDDLDGDGVVDLVAQARITYRLPEAGHQRKPYLPPIDLGVIWGKRDVVASSTLPSTALLYLVAPSLAGGKPMLVSADGARIVIDGDKLTALPVEHPADGTPSCLQTSATEPARFRAR